MEPGELGCNWHLRADYVLFYKDFWGLPDWLSADYRYLPVPDPFDIMRQRHWIPAGLPCGKRLYASPPYGCADWGRIYRDTSGGIPGAFCIHKAVPAEKNDRYLWKAFPGRLNRENQFPEG